MTRLPRLVLAAVLLGNPQVAAAQEMGGPAMMGAPMMGPPAFLERLFVPALVMRHQQEIDLSAQQRQAITKEMGATQQKLLELRWQLEAKSEALTKLMAAERIDETAALARAGEVLDLERQLKQAHLTLLIRIKNQLTADQQAKLDTFRRREDHRRHHGGGPPPSPEAPVQ